MLVSNLLAKVRSLGLLSLCAHLLIALALLALVLFLFPSYLKPYWPSGYDTFGHLAKVESFARMISQYGNYVDWSDEWYAGYHPLLFYPPLSYAFPVLLRLLSVSMSAVARFSILAGIWAAAFSGYLLGLALLRPANGARARILALVPAVVYSTIPAVIALQTVAGEFADFWAGALAPLAAASLLLWLQCRRLRYLAALAISLSVVFLMHGHIATPLGLGFIVAAFVYDFIGDRGARGEQNVSDGAYRGFWGTLLAMLLFVGLTAFWWLPYFVESPSLAIPNLVPLSRTALPLYSLINRSVAAGTPRYLGLVALFLAALGLWLGERKKVALLVSLAAVGVLMFLGPSWEAYSQIPVLGLVFAERAVPLIAVAISGLAMLGVAGVVTRLDQLFSDKAGALSSSRVFLLFKTVLIPLVFVIAAGSAILADASFILPRTKAQAMPSDFWKLTQFLAKQPRSYGARVAFVPSAALDSYAPALSGWPILGGYLVQGSKLSTEIEWVMSRELTKTDRRAALAAFKRWNIAYIAVDHYSRPEIARALEVESSFSKVFSTDYYSLFRYSSTPGYLAPARSVLVVGDSRYIRETLERSAEDAGEQILFSEGEIDKLREGRYDTIIFPGGTAPEGFEKEVKRKVSAGANAVIDLDGAGVKSFIGVKVQPVRFRGPLPVVNLNEDTHVADATYMEGPWDTVEFEGLDEVWLSTGKKALAGVKRIGKGRVLFLGFNPFYHAAYKGDEWEKRELVAMFRRLAGDKNPASSFTYRLLKIVPGSKLFEINVADPTSVLISSSWSPYWSAYLDGRPLALNKAQDMLVVEVPKGRHQFWLKFSSWSVARLIGVAISLLTLILAGAGAFFVTRRRSQVRVADEAPGSLEVGIGRA